MRGITNKHPNLRLHVASGSWGPILRSLVVWTGLLTATSWAQPVQLVSKADPDLLSDTVGAGGGPCAVSQDGRFTLFQSKASNLVPGQVDGGSSNDVFLYDRVTGEVSLISHVPGSPTTAGNDFSTCEVAFNSLSSDGNIVLFGSRATDLVSGFVDTNGLPTDIFLHDRTTGTTTLVSHAVNSAVTTGNDSSGAALLSADGRFAAFQSRATDLVAGFVDNNGTGFDVFLYDRADGSTTLLSRAAGSVAAGGNGTSHPAAIDSAGSRVAFESRATDLISGLTDVNGLYDIFVYDRSSGTTLLVSHQAASPTTTGNRNSGLPALSGDGAFIAFLSQATDLVPGFVDGNGLTRGDIFLHDIGANATTLVSHVAGAPNAGADHDHEAPTISGTGDLVAYSSRATNLVAGATDANGRYDIFLYDRATGLTTLISHAAGSPTTTANDSSHRPSIGGAGARIAFESRSRDLVAGQSDFNEEPDVFLYDRATGAMELVSRAAGSVSPQTGNRHSNWPLMSEDGEMIAFTSLASDLAAGALDLNQRTDVFVFDRPSAVTTLVTLHEPASPSLSGSADSYTSSSPTRTGKDAVSADGRYLVFWSFASNLVPGQVDDNQYEDVFLYDRVLDTTTLVSHAYGLPATAGDGLSGNPTISRDGSTVAFESAAPDLVPGMAKTHGSTDVFVYDVAAGTTTLVSHADGLPHTTGSSWSHSPALSEDGRFVAFLSRATDLVAGQVDVNGFQSDVFLHDRTLATTTLVSHQAGQPNRTANRFSFTLAISADGSAVAYQSQATDLVAGQVDANGTDYDIFLYDRLAGASVLISHAADSTVTTGDRASEMPAISADGLLVAFASQASNLVPGQVDSTNSSDVFLHDRLLGQNVLISHSEGLPAVAADGSSFSPAIDRDASAVAFVSAAGDLVPGFIDTNGTAADLFLYDRAAGAAILVSRAAGLPTTTADGRTSDLPLLSDDGTVVTFLSTARDLVTGHDTDIEKDVFWYDSVTDTMRLASHTADSETAAANDGSSSAGLSGDGRWVVFSSDGDDLVEGDFNDARDVFLFQAIDAPRLFEFTGFFPPVENPPVLNSARAGSAIPLKFSLGGDQGLDIMAPGYPVSGEIACESSAPGNVVEETSTAGSSSLSYDPVADQYNYVWKSDKSWAGTCRQLVLKLVDGSSHQARFRFE